MFASSHQRPVELGDLRQKKTIVPAEIKTVEILHDPRDYVFKEEKEYSDSSEFCFYVLGCAGNGSKAQKEVAKLMEQIAAGTKKRPKYIVILGDNFYDNGVASENDPAFNTHFHDIYGAKELVETKGIPCFVIGGNHDHNLHRGFYGYKHGDARGDALIAAQVKHTFLEEGVLSAEKVNKYAKPKLKLSKLQKWNFPRPYYSCTSPGNPEKAEKDVQSFFVDSPTYVRDFLNSLPDGCDAGKANNQANWLARMAKENPDAIKFLFLHQPLKTMDKRISEDDAYLYLTTNEIRKLSMSPFKFTGNYNDLLRQIFKFQGLHFNTVFSAHTHAMAYFNEEKPDGLCQVIAGGGGGPPQNRHDFTNRTNLPCFMKNHGFVSVQVKKNDPNKIITFDFYATHNEKFPAMKNLHLQFTNQSAAPVQLPNDKKEAANVTILREIVLEACNLYYDNVNAPTKSWVSSNVFHSKSGSHRADDLVNFFNRYESLTFKEAVDYVKFRMTRQTKARNHSLETYFDQCLRRVHNISYEQFIENPDLILLITVSLRKVTQPRPIPAKDSLPGSDEGPNVQQFSASWEEVVKTASSPQRSLVAST